ncbi:MAG: Fur family transcriptional regulator [Jatrophihabitans sp.]
MATVTHDQEVRRTRAGEQVRSELAKGVTFRSAQTVFSALRADGSGVGLSTVYRHLQVLADSGAADTVQTAAGEVLYRYCGDTKRHHHHLVCRRCGTTVEVAGPAVERWAGKVATDNGFVDVDHTVELLGLCATCASTR